MTVADLRRVIREGQLPQLFPYLGIRSRIMVWYNHTNVESNKVTEIENSQVAVVTKGAKAIRATSIATAPAVLPVLQIALLIKPFPSTQPSRVVNDVTSNTTVRELRDKVVDLTGAHQDDFVLIRDRTFKMLKQLDQPLSHYGIVGREEVIHMTIPFCSRSSGDWHWEPHKELLS